MQPVRVTNSNEWSWTGHRVCASALLAVLVAIPLVRTARASDPPDRLNLEAVFAREYAGTGPLTPSAAASYASYLDLYTRSWSSFCASGPVPQMTLKYVHVTRTFNGATFRGWRAHLPRSNWNVGSAKEFTSRITVEMWLPIFGGGVMGGFTDPDTALVLIAHGGSIQGGASSSLVTIATNLASKHQIPAVVWYEGDPAFDPNACGPGIVSDLGSGDACVDDPPYEAGEGFGLAGSDDKLLISGTEWMMWTGNPAGLSGQSLRLDYRYALGQAFLYSATFFQRYIVKAYGTGPNVLSWVGNLRVFYSGFSKFSGGALLAAGLDARHDPAPPPQGTGNTRTVAGVALAGQQIWDTSALGAAHRYESDWLECPAIPPPTSMSPAVPCGSLRMFDAAHQGARIGKWSWENRNNHTSHFDVYFVGENACRYEDLLILDYVGTHDYVNPLGSSTAFWRAHDRLLDGGGGYDLGELKLNFRLSRGINRDHGVAMPVEASGGPGELNVKDQHIYRAMLYLKDRTAHPFPRIEMQVIDTPVPACDGSATEWSVTVYVDPSELPVTSEPYRWQNEKWRVYVAMSDDRDFRRVDGNPTFPVNVCTNLAETVLELIPREGPVDHNNLEDEDKFVAMDIPTSSVELVDVTGQTIHGLFFRRLRFSVPPDFCRIVQQSGRVPLTCLIARMTLEGSDATSVLDDIQVYTDAVFAFEEGYPELDCDQQLPFSVGSSWPPCATTPGPGQAYTPLLFNGAGFDPAQSPMARFEFPTPVTVPATVVTPFMASCTPPNPPGAGTYNVFFLQGSQSAGPFTFDYR